MLGGGCVAVAVVGCVEGVGGVEVVVCVEVVCVEGSVAVRLSLRAITAGRCGVRLAGGAAAAAPSAVADWGCDPNAAASAESARAQPVSTAASNCRCKPNAFCLESSSSP